MCITYVLHICNICGAAPRAAASGRVENMALNPRRKITSIRNAGFVKPAHSFCYPYVCVITAKLFTAFYILSYQFCSCSGIKTKRDMVLRRWISQQCPWTSLQEVGEARSAYGLDCDLHIALICLSALVSYPVGSKYHTKIETMLMTCDVLQGRPSPWASEAGFSAQCPFPSPFLFTRGAWGKILVWKVHVSLS